MHKIIMSCLCAIISLSSYANDEQYLVKPFDNLTQILKSLEYGESYRELLPIINQTVELNPQAFKNRNPNFLLPGITLTLPSNPNRVIPEPVPKPQPIAEPSPRKPVGTISITKGRSDILRDTDTLTVDKQENIFVEDIILTRDKTQAEIILNDDSIITLGPNTELVVNEFSFSKSRQPGERPNDSLIATINKGVMRMITGLIGQNKRNQFSIKSAFSATIGIRGTDFTVRTCLQAATCGGLFGVSAAVMDGGINLQNKASVVSLDKNEFAQVKSVSEPPQKSPLPEGFFDLDRDPSDISLNLSWWEKTVNWVRSKL